MKKTYSQTFLKGTLILASANLLVKIIGAIFKIPLKHLIGNDGMGIFGTSYEIYKWLFIIATAGFPIAISKMVAESTARNNHKEAHKIFNVAFFLLSIIGVIGTAIMFFGAQFFSNAIGNSRAYIAVKAMSPSLLFVAIMSAYRGYFQGLRNMVPTAISEVIEALGKLVIGYLFAYLWISRGVEYGASGAILGVTSGAFFGAIGLYFMYQYYYKKHIRYEIEMSNELHVKVKSSRRIVSELIKIAIPIAVGASVFSLTSLIDLSMIMTRLQSIGYSEKQSSTLYGMLSGQAVTLFNLPPTIIMGLSVSIVPAIARALEMKQIEKAKKLTETALRITLLFVLACGAGLFILSKPILLLLFKEDSASTMLSILAVAVVFVCVVSLTNSIIQATGRILIPVRNMIIGGIAKIIINYVLVGNPEININGAPIGTTICYLIITVLNLIEIKRITKAKYSFKELLFKPIIGVGAMSVSVIFIYNKLRLLTHLNMSVRASNAVATFVSILIGIIIYGVMLIAIGSIKKGDLDLLPKGEKVQKLLIKLKLLK